ncbi:hypothetical protein E2C01_083439 [Portunus trituberculatus]|uniref:Uncharacterized protein n=1 Tax=Portunus trituberculatus TaxID=210409 RepID=A0A5B7IX88_PORTR|nr:hypothetical protein [Portunus trituberculatus]
MQREERESMTSNSEERTYFSGGRYQIQEQQLQRTERVGTICEELEMVEVKHLVCILEEFFCQDSCCAAGRKAREVEDYHVGNILLMEDGERQGHWAMVARIEDPEYTRQEGPILGGTATNQDAKHGSLDAQSGTETDEKAVGTGGPLRVYREKRDHLMHEVKTGEDHITTREL